MMRRVSCCRTESCDANHANHPARAQCSRLRGSASVDLCSARDPICRQKKKNVAWRRRSSRQLSDQTTVTCRPPHRCRYARATPTVYVVVFEVRKFSIMKNKEVQQKRKRKTSGWNGLNSFSSTLLLFSSVLLSFLHLGDSCCRCSCCRALPAPSGQITAQAANHEASVALTAGLEPAGRILSASLVKFLSCWCCLELTCYMQKNKIKYKNMYLNIYFLICEFTKVGV